MEFKNWIYTENTSPIVYHVTYYCYLKSISNAGIDFENNSGSNYFKPHLISNSQQGTFFVTNIEGVKHWIGVMEDQATHRSDDIYEDGFIPVILKFRLNQNKYQPDPEKETEFDRKTTRKIPPEGIMVWSGKQWLPIYEWENVNTSYFVDFEDNPDDSEKPFCYIRSPYQKPFKPTGGFKGAGSADGFLKRAREVGFGIHSWTGGYPLPPK